ncbi:MAG: universal stress protein, partial [Candidatus Hydrogenedentes bacterium]|nr:universal stress protein [Candidatus Hydrogenedentota bacterium]
MFRNSSILVPTDFSEQADHARTYALALAKQFNGTLHFVHVVDATMLAGVRGDDMSLGGAGAVELLQTMRVYGEQGLAQRAAEAKAEGVSADQHLVVGNPTHEILRLIEETQSTLVVLATHGRSGFQHFVFGSVAERIVRESPVPVLSVKEPTRKDGALAIRRVLFPTDFSPFSEKARPFAESLARQFGATLVLFHATEVPVMLP